MLGNLLGRIGNVLADTSFQSHAESQLSLHGVSFDDGAEVSLKCVSKEGLLTDGDKRKVTFSEAVMEKTISARTSYESACDMSQESHRGINKELESLDLSMNSESFVSDPGSVKSPLSQSHSHEEEDLMVFQNTADRTSNSGNSLEEEDPFLDTVLPRLPPNFVLKSPFVESNMSAKVFGSEAQVAIPIKQGINPDELCIKALSDQELNSDNETSEAIEDDFVQLKLDAESGIRYNDPDFQNEEFQEIGNISDILDEMYEEHEEESELLEDACFISQSKPPIPMTPRSVAPEHDLGLFSPGTFFSEKSGQMGQLGGSAKIEERPLWYTPRADDYGHVTDLIESTPTTQTEKYLRTPRGSRFVRPPLYSSPSSRLAKQHADRHLSDVPECPPQDTSQIDSYNQYEELSEQESCGNVLSVAFPPVHSRKTSRLSLSVNNPTPKASAWIIKAIGPAYVSLPNGRRPPLSDNVFKFLLTKGKVEAGSSIDLSVTFSPILTGEHYQTFHLRSHNQVIVLELSGHLKSAASTANRNSLPLKAKKSTKSDRPRALPKVMFKRTASDTQLSLRQVHICNSQSERMDIQLEVTKPWQIPTQRVTIDAGSFLELPVAFCPSQSGYYQGVLRVTSSDGRSSELCLEGEMHP